jgi:hypothetical protein
VSRRLTYTVLNVRTLTRSTVRSRKSQVEAFGRRQLRSYDSPQPALRAPERQRRLIVVMVRKIRSSPRNIYFAISSVLFHCFHSPALVFSTSSPNITRGITVCKGEQSTFAAKSSHTSSKPQAGFVTQSLPGFADPAVGSTHMHDCSCSGFNSSQSHSK